MASIEIPGMREEYVRIYYVYPHGFEKTVVGRLLQWHRDNGTIKLEVHYLSEYPVYDSFVDTYYLSSPGNVWESDVKTISKEEMARYTALNLLR